MPINGICPTAKGGGTSSVDIPPPLIQSPFLERVSYTESKSLPAEVSVDKVKARSPVKGKSQRN